MSKKNIAVFASGKGSNFSAIVNSIKCGYIKNATIKLLITDKKNALARIKAKKVKIKAILIDPRNYKTRLELDKEIVKILRREKIDLIVLAGYMRILSSYFVRTFNNKIINIHPALLPAFKGKNAIERAFHYGCKLTGVTVHFVNEKVDDGPIILQKSIPIINNMTFKNLVKKIHTLEHKLYPLAIKKITSNKIKVSGRYVQIN
ncbi:MAG: phosphoribosylglycinamide formyltransferase [Candidatus Omnitrophica bacterium]|jgi:phosphoribosylglycinamide formyltransferase-1|nr:phosphoribosylglycinamide formyltransferase [Candidatus Omnitrophota bacterium]